MENDPEVLAIFEQTGALKHGHFVLRSGLHSPHYFQCASLGQDLAKMSCLVAKLLPRLRDLNATTVLAPAMGGLVFGQEVARQLDLRYIFAEKQNDNLVLRRGFRLSPGERVLIAEDVVTRGGRVEECLAIVRSSGAVPAGIAVLVDRSDGAFQPEVPLVSLARLSFPTYPADQLPPELAILPIEKPGS